MGRFMPLCLVVRLHPACGHIRQFSTPTTASTLMPSEIVTMKEMRRSMLAMMSSQKAWLDSANQEAVLAALPTNQSELPSKSMKDSWLEGTIPLATNMKERLKYLTPFGFVRFGKLLEDLDTFAVAACYKHNEDPSLKVTGFTETTPDTLSGVTDGEFVVPRAIWTVLVDRIDLTPAFASVSNSRDVRLSGSVSWVGKSSMESTVTVSQTDENGDDVELLAAVFVMVARNPLNNTSSLVCPLMPQNVEEEEILAHSQNMQDLRRQMCDISLLKTTPNPAEQETIHKIFLSTLSPSATTFKTRVKPEDTIWMEDSMLKTCQICFPEQKNLYEKIFGGFLMRQAFELAWANASMYSKKRCLPLAVDDILFRSPVSIGSFLFLASQVGYTDGNKMQVRVHAEVRNPETGEDVTTNEFHFTLQTIDGSAVSRVLPKTYAESMIYLDSQRRLNEAVGIRTKPDFTARNVSPGLRPRNPSLGLNPRW